jgi:DNA-binding winged helix-turn-helix (wHTH) protein
VRFQFATFTLDDDRRQLLGGEAAIHLSPKAYELLKVLVEQRPRALSKAELHERLWPDTFVSEVNLAALVAEVRAALREPGRHGRFIRTVHGFGYAFAHDVRAEHDEAGRPREAVSKASATRACWLSWGDRDYALIPGAQTVGRDAGAEVRIDALSISRTHARVTWLGPVASIEDLGSKNGTWVNGARVEGRVGLEDGDEVRLGTITLTFRNLNAPGSTVTVGNR